MNKICIILNNLILVFAVYLVSYAWFLYFFQRNLLYYPAENNNSGDRLAVSIEKS